MKFPIIPLKDGDNRTIELDKQDDGTFKFRYNGEFIKLTWFFRIDTIVQLRDHLTEQINLQK